MKARIDKSIVFDLEIQERREKVFLVLAGIFICSMTMLNVIGITRFIQLGPLALAAGNANNTAQR